MTPLELSDDARADLDEILSYSTLRHGDPIATEYYFSFDAAFAVLRQYPQAGREADEIETGVRCLSHRSHRIFYEIVEGRLSILRVLHHSMDVEGRLGE